MYVTPIPIANVDLLPAVGFTKVSSVAVISRVGADGPRASLQPMVVPSVNRFGEPEVTIGSVELAGLRRLTTEGIGERLSAGAERCSAAMFD